MGTQGTHPREDDEASSLAVVVQQVDADSLVRDALVAESPRGVRALAILMNACLPLAPLPDGACTLRPVDLIRGATGRGAVPPPRWLKAWQGFCRDAHLLQQRCMGIALHRIAIARSVLQAISVKHPNMSTVILDEPAALQIPGRLGDADTPHTQHVGKEFLRDGETVGMSAILAHQQPACETLSDRMKSQTGGRSRQL